MKVIFLLFTFLCCAFGKERGGRVVGGTNAIITQRFYQASILLDGQHFCGGTIINQYNILSAAHCFQLDTHALRQYLVKVGSIYIDQGTIYPIYQIKLHERFVNYEYDVAMVTLRVPLVLSTTTNVIPIDRTDTFTAGKIGIATGWSSQAIDPNVLHQVNLDNVKQQLCRQLYSDFTTITDNMFCAGNIGGGGVGACSGSFGGPIVLNNRLIGISSFSNGCAEIGYPTVFTKLFGLLPWLDSAATARPK